MARQIDLKENFHKRQSRRAPQNSPLGLVRDYKKNNVKSYEASSVCNNEGLQFNQSLEEVTKKIQTTMLSDDDLLILTAASIAKSYTRNERPEA
jgi:hypothetical protein